MPQVEIVIGGRSFEVACQPGEEAFLQAAAEVLDVEASALSSQIGRMPEGRMLLMAGLMLADKASGLEEQLRAAEAEIQDLRIREAAAPREVKVPVVPEEVSRVMVDLAAEAEALARAVLAVVPERAKRKTA